MINSFKRRQKAITKEKEIEKNHEKNVRNKLKEKYENYFMDNTLELYKININFIPTPRKSKKLNLVEPISGLPNLEFIPCLYVCSKNIFDGRKIKNKEKEAIIPKTLIESIVYPYYKKTGGDFKEVKIKEGAEPFKYFLEDNNGFNMYIKLHKKKENEMFWRGKETKGILRYRKNKEIYDEILFNSYIKQLNREIKIFKKKCNEEDMPLLETKVEPPDNVEFCMTKKGSLCGLVFQVKNIDGTYNPILYRYVKENSNLENIDKKIQPFLEKSTQAASIHPSMLNKIPLVNDNFDEKYFEIFKNRFNGIVENYQQE
jgi:hypothetical protein